MWSSSMNLTNYSGQGGDPLYLESHSSPEAIRRRCTYLHSLPPEERCNFTMHSQCDSETHLFMYHHFMFCTLPNASFHDPLFIFFIFVMLLVVFLLFICLGTIADEFFCPALGIICNLLGLSEDIAGVTLLAFGNGAADILGCLTDPYGETILMYNQLLGGTMFVTCIIAGYIAFSRPFKLQVYPFLRDSIFILISVIWVLHSVQDEVISIYESSSFLALYLIYIIIVIGGVLIRKKIKKYVTIVEEEPVRWEELRAKSRLSVSRISIMGKSRVSFTDSDTTDSSSFEEIDQMSIKHGKVTCRELLQDMWDHINPKPGDWNELSKFEKTFAVIRAPVLFTFRLFMPVVQLGEDKNGWCKLLNTFQCVFLPSYILTLADYYNLELFGVTAYAPALGLGVLIAIVVALTSDFHKPPRYHNVFALMCLVGAMATICFFVKEVVPVLVLFGTMGKIKIGSLGLTVLAWGNSVGDLISNVAIARRGFQRMAFAGCFGGPIANLLLSLGITFVIRDVGTTTLSTMVRVGVMGPVCSTFILISLSYSIFYILLTNFEARKSYGAFLILIYSEFVLYCFLIEIDLMHPLGTDHEFDVDLYKTFAKSKW